MSGSSASAQSDAPLQPKAPSKPWVVLTYALYTIVVPILLVASVLYFRVYDGLDSGTLAQWQAYALAWPMILAVGLCLAAGLLLLSLQKTWTIALCALSGVVIAAAYYYPSLQLPGGFPGETCTLTYWLSLSYCAIALLIPLAMPFAVQELRRKTPVPSAGEITAPRRVGTLHYTGFGLAVLFIWLLWGDFVFTIMEGVVPSLMSLKLKDLATASGIDQAGIDMLISVITVTIPGVLNFVITPTVSFQSDRHRGRWGRRAPYIVLTMPFLVVALVALGCTDDLASYLHGWISWLASTSPASVALGVFAVCLVLYFFSNMFVNTVYWYLFNDVVPPQFLGRFMGLFRLTGGVAGSLFSFFLYGQLLTHTREIFTAVAMLYFVGFSLMFLFVREGKYDPPPALAVEAKNWSEIGYHFKAFFSKTWNRWLGFTFLKKVQWALLVIGPIILVLGVFLCLVGVSLVGFILELTFIAAIPWLYRRVTSSIKPKWAFQSGVVGFFAGLAKKAITYGKDCFTHRFYWYFYLMNAFGAIGGATATFGIFFSRDEMGLSLQQLGEIGGVVGIAHFLATYFVSVFVDRWHPLRISTYNAVVGAVGGWGAIMWVFVTLPNNLYYWLSLMGGLVVTFGVTLQGACELPLFMRVLPKSLYGELSSANAMIRALARIGSSLVVGGFMAVLLWFCHAVHIGDGYRYRLMFVWGWVFSCLYTVFICLLYREWKKLGGDDNYRPPASWKPEGYEEVVDKARSIPSKPRLVMWSLWLGMGGVALDFLFIAAFMNLMHQHGLNRSFYLYAWFYIPVRIVLTCLSFWQLWAIRSDIRKHQQGKPTKYGIPHHGVLLVNVLQGLASFSIYLYQTVTMIKNNLESELIIFAIVGLGGGFTSMLGTHILRWIEKEPSKPARPSSPPAVSASDLLLDTDQPQPALLPSAIPSKQPKPSEA